ncbi:MAG: hypothetical protein ABFQ62_05330 [Patescibacteria group bacterium]
MSNKWETKSIYQDIGVLADEALVKKTDNPFLPFKDGGVIENPELSIEVIDIPPELSKEIDRLSRALDYVYKQYGSSFEGKIEHLTFFKTKNGATEIQHSFSTNLGLIYINIDDALSTNTGKLDIDKALTITAHEWTHVHGIAGVSIRQNPDYEKDLDLPAYIPDRYPNDWFRTNMSTEGSKDGWFLYSLMWLKEISIGLVTFKVMKKNGFRKESHPDIVKSSDFQGLHESYESIADLFDAFLNGVLKGVSKLPNELESHLQIIEKDFRLPRNQEEICEMLIQAHFNRNAFNALVVLLYEIYSAEKLVSKTYINKWEAIVDDINIFGIELEPQMLLVE